MDSINFQIRHTPDAADDVLIFVNGRDLVEILREIELPYAKAEGSPSIAGGYTGLPPEDVAPPSKHFLGEPRWDVYRYGDKVEILVCDGCEVPGCWPFLVKIAASDQHVTWSDFEQPHREQDARTGNWTYNELKPFVFAREQYDAALDSLAAQYRDGQGRGRG